MDDINSTSLSFIPGWLKIILEESDEEGAFLII